jgi:hypothetical protein
MSDAAAPLPETAPPTARAALAQRQIGRLDELAELGLVCARAVARQAEAEQPDVADIALAYSRVSRAVRLTILLQSKLADALEAAEDEAAEYAARTHPVYVKKARVEAVVERLAEAEHPDDEDAVDRIVIEAGERLDDEHLYGDLMDRPFEEIVERICRELGLAREATRPPPQAGEAPQRGGGGTPQALRPDHAPSVALRQLPRSAGEHALEGTGPPPAIAAAMGEVVTPPTPAPAPDWF